jgi:hypothetical protein
MVKDPGLTTSSKQIFAGRFSAPILHGGFDNRAAVT